MRRNVLETAKQFWAYARPLVIAHGVRRVATLLRPMDPAGRYCRVNGITQNLSRAGVRTTARARLGDS